MTVNMRTVEHTGLVVDLMWNLVGIWMFATVDVTAMACFCQYVFDRIVEFAVLQPIFVPLSLMISMDTDMGHLPPRVLLTLIFFKRNFDMLGRMPYLFTAS